MAETLHKIKTAVATLANWPLVVADKLHLVAHPVYHTRSGMIFACRGGTNDINQITAVLSGDEYPLSLLKVPPGSWVVDLGAHIGSFSSLVALINGTDARGLAVEPAPENFALLQKNLASNSIMSIRALAAAVADHDGTVPFDASGNPNAFHIGEARRGYLEVSAKKLSTLCSEQGIDAIDLLKMDIEGAEYGVLAVDYPFVARCVRRFILEYHIIPNATPERLLRLLERDFSVQTLHRSPRNGVVYAVNRHPDSSL